MNKPIFLIFVGPYRQKAQQVFNGNAYPANVSSVVNACASRYAFLLLHRSNIQQALQRDFLEFRCMIENHRADMERALKKNPGISFVAGYDGLAHLAEMHSSLNILKSFLDLYAKLMGKLISPTNNWSFDKANIGGQKVSGGRLVNALLNSGQQSLVCLAEFTLENSQNWITEAVKYRDQLSHRSDLDEMRHMQLQLHSNAPHINFDELERPAMPNGQDLEEYFDGLLSNLTMYICKSISMLPNVDSTLISPEKLMAT